MLSSMSNLSSTLTMKYCVDHPENNNPRPVSSHGYG